MLHLTPISNAPSNISHECAPRRTDSLPQRGVTLSLHAMCSNKLLPLPYLLVITWHHKSWGLVKRFHKSFIRKASLICLGFLMPRSPFSLRKTTNVPFNQMWSSFFFSIPPHKPSLNFLNRIANTFWEARILHMEVRD